MMNSFWALLGIVLLAACISGVLTALARVLSRRFELVDRPDGDRKAHDHPIPLGGGIALFCSFLMTVIVAEWVGLDWLVKDTATRSILPVLIMSAALFCLIGLWDDKWSLRARYKFLLQIVACVPFALWVETIDSVNILGAELDLGPFGVVFTLFWLVACVNIVNLIDGLDGLAGTLTIIVCLTLAIVAMMGSKFDIAAVALILMGCMLGFLLHNWPPARIFLGDSGSLMIGYLIGALSIEASLKTAAGFTMAVPLVLMGVPIFDTAMAILRRKLNGRHIGEPDREHIHHRLQDRGLTRTQSLLAISALCVVMAIAAIVSAALQNDLVALATGTTILAILIGGRIFGYDETVLFFRNVKEAGSVLWQSSGILRIRIVVRRLTPRSARRQFKEGIVKLNRRRVKHSERVSSSRLERPRDTEAPQTAGENSDTATEKRRAA